MPADPSVITVRSPQGMTRCIEGIFGAVGTVASLAPLIQQARNKLEATVLGNMEGASDSLAGAWKGGPASLIAPSAPIQGEPPELREQFANFIAETLASGLVSLNQSWFSGKLSLTFPVFLGTGAGEDAAQLVAATLASHGVQSTVYGTKVTFSPSQEERRALMEFKKAVTDVDTHRRELFLRLGR
jgi:hypothetical protein